jgi:hypothetical protein
MTGSFPAGPAAGSGGSWDCQLRPSVVARITARPAPTEQDQAHGPLLAVWYLA